MTKPLGESIFHVHAKDIRINRWNAENDGLLDTVPINIEHEDRLACRWTTV